MNLEKRDENENKLNIIANKTKYSLPNVTFPCRNLPWKINLNISGFGTAWSAQSKVKFEY